MILGLRQIGKKDLVTVRQGLVVVLIRRHGCFCSCHDGVGFLLIAWLCRSQHGHIHVACHVRHAALLTAVDGRGRQAGHTKRKGAEGQGPPSKTSHE